MVCSGQVIAAWPAGGAVSETPALAGTLKILTYAGTCGRVPRRVGASPVITNVSQGVAETPGGCRMGRMEA